MAEEKQEAIEGTSGDQDQSGEATKGKSKKLIVMIAGILLILGAGATTFFMMSGGSKGEKHLAAKAGPDGEQPVLEDEDIPASPTKTAPSSDGKTAAQKPDSAKAGAATKTNSTSNVSFGETYQMKTFHLNLGNPLENHYIRVDVALEYRGGEEQKAEIERRLPQLRDAVVGVISRQTRDMILDPDGKAQLRREMLIRVNRYMTKPVEAVYITDILIE